MLGDNSQVNRNVATALAGAMRYTPIVTEDIVEKLIKMPLADLVAEEGDGGAHPLLLIVPLSRVSSLPRTKTSPHPPAPLLPAALQPPPPSIG